MAILEIKVLKEKIEKVPEDFEIEFTSGKNVFKLGDKFSVNVSEKKITFEKFWLIFLGNLMKFSSFDNIRTKVNFIIEGEDIVFYKLSTEKW